MKWGKKRLKVLLIAMSARYVHKSLGVRSIRAYLAAQGYVAEVLEYTTAQETMRIVADIVRRSPDVIGFSCYIWNVEHIFPVADAVKKAMPQSFVVLGGPEVSYTPEETLRRCLFADAIMCGEGEETYAKLLRGEQEIPGLVRRGGRLSKAAPLDLTQVPFPYTKEELAETESIFYYESSRGCPYRCAYCLSAAETGVRYKPLDLVQNDLKQFVESGVRLVKLVDRTFNCDDKRAQRILDIILKLGGRTQFHFEVAAETLSEAFMDKLAQFPPGKIRLEVGLQSVHPKTLAAVDRKEGVVQIEQNLRRIARAGNVEVHLDLIAGLPLETLDDFRVSFDRAMAMEADELQLGFLKLLPGAPLTARVQGSAYAWSAYPPYEVVQSDAMSFLELAELKDIEAVVDAYWNQGAFCRIRHLLAQHTESLFDCCRETARYMAPFGWLNVPQQRTQRFAQLVAFLRHSGRWTKDMQRAAVQDFLMDCPDVQLPQWVKGLQKAPVRLTEVLQQPMVMQLCQPEGEKKHWHRRYNVWRYEQEYWLADKFAKKIWEITPYF